MINVNDYNATQVAATFFKNSSNPITRVINNIAIGERERERERINKRAK
jgi:hypothetical protein